MAARQSGGKGKQDRGRPASAPATAGQPFTLHRAGNKSGSGSPPRSAKSKPKPGKGERPQSPPPSRHTSPTPTAKSSAQTPASGIPPLVSQRMIRRVIWFSGLPTVLGLSSFGVNYLLLTQDIVQLPPFFTLVESLTLFGLGFVGITYGVLSASWTDEPGSVLGLAEFKHNVSLMIQQWRQSAAQTQKNKDNS